ncbi:MAG: deoxyribodipyrimidine photo-lyase [Rhodopseudomonas sp.]|nr:deoxyribodipyrimidine photo-lyase [Rhodopseudomonas sp.]
MTTLLWFRQDLRLRDNPALVAAAERGPVVPVFIIDTSDTNWAPGGASLWWLHHSLAALRNRLGALSLFKGDPRVLLPQIARASGATSVHWNRCYEPHAIARDTDIKAALKELGVEAQSFNAALLHEPWQIATGSGSPFKVFTPYWRAASAKDSAAPLPPPSSIDVRDVAGGDRLDDWRLLPRNPDWAAGWDRIWTPGEEGALDRFESFVASDLVRYGEDRDRPDLQHTSRLSPHLHWGEISPRQIATHLALAVEGNPAIRSGVDKFMSEIGWREFAHHLLYHYPSLPDRNWRAGFDAYPWRDGAADLEAWQQGRTGYPFVDAGMRELWQTGFMHNRVRMVAASFLVKHLRIDWRRGEQWFWDTLLDADLANNAAGWQWVAGSGADASPYFRIFNPVLQGEKFDPDGDYIRRWCPELKELSNADIHAPFKAKAEALARAGVVLGKTYPRPIVDHDAARQAALAGYRQVKDGAVQPPPAGL